MTKKTLEKDYPFRENEKKWQQIWEEKDAFFFNPKSKKKKFYVLEMLPYPSGKLHMGHVRNYSAGDVIARYKTMQGENVLHPIGWDSFGLPAENAAIEKNLHPKLWTLNNIAEMKRQLRSMGLSYDWSKEISTCSPEYYKHEQSLFIQMYKNNLAYRKESSVNWDPVDKTVLANEQIIDGKGWRSGAKVETKTLKQWFLRVSNYSQSLLDGLKKLDSWPEKIKSMQKKWIGKSVGAKITFPLNENSICNSIEIFTTRADTIFGASFIGISPLHPLSQKLAKTNEKIKKFIHEYSIKNRNSTISEKEGIETKLFAVNPLSKKQFKYNGKNVSIPQLEEIPIYITNFVLMEYGEGAIFGCPAHDERDMEFAQKYQLPIKPVVAEKNNKNQSDNPSKPFTKEGIAINSFFINELKTNIAKKEITNVLMKLKLGKEEVNFKIKDWGVSRQRYWGCPIPMVYCDSCGIVPEREENLPIILPEDIELNTNGNPLENHPTWKYCKCPNCNKDAIRETDTFDTFFESSWYFLRYISPYSKDKPFEKEDVDRILPVDEYIGGIEHAVLHLIYARFFTHVLKDLGFLSFTEPFKKVTTQGMVCHRAYQSSNGTWIEPNEIIQKEGQFYVKNTNEKILDRGIIKMSKSKKNVVDPEKMIELYGADAVRMFILSDSPLEKDIEWRELPVCNIVQYLNKIWRMVNKVAKIVNENKNKIDILNTSLNEVKQNNENFNTIQKINKTIEQYSINIENLEFNKGIAALHIFFNQIEQIDITKKENDLFITIVAISFIRLLSPFAPHIAEEAWERFGYTKSILKYPLPSYDRNLGKSIPISIGVQVNGKLRSSITLSPDATEKEHEDLVLADKKIINYINKKKIKKILIVKGRIVNVLTEN